jgi:hypothetical protein
MNITHILVMNIHNSVGLNICLYFRSYSPSLNSIGNKTKKNLSVLISFGLKKSVGLNILVKSVLIFSILVTGPLFSTEIDRRTLHKLGCLIQQLRPFNMLCIIFILCVTCSVNKILQYNTKHWDVAEMVLNYLITPIDFNIIGITPIILNSVTYQGFHREL